MKQHGPTPFVMERDEAAAFLGMTESELIARSKEPGFPRHSGYWGRWWFYVDALEKWKAAQQKPAIQLELSDIISAKTAKDETEITPAMKRYFAQMRDELEADIMAKLTAKLFYRKNRYAVQG